MTKVFFVFLSIFLVGQQAQAQQIPPLVAARVIMSEAGNQGLKGMICVAEVLRKRGSIKGFYGDRNNQIKGESPGVWKMALQAWQISEYTHYTHGADHFENVHLFGQPWWAKYCKKTYEYKDHVFYKEVRKRRNG